MREASRRYYDEQRAWTIKVLTDPELTGNGRVVGAFWMQKYVNRYTACVFVSQETLAAALGFNPKTVQRAMTRLQKLSYIKFVGYHWRAKMYLAVGVTPIDDGGQQRPASSDDIRQSTRCDRTFEGGDNGLRCPPNHSKPNEPRPTEYDLDCFRKRASKLPQVKVDGIVEHWERNLRQSHRVADAMMRVRREDLEAIAVALEQQSISIREAEHLMIFAQRGMRCCNEKE